jgi:hypothetical protein
MYLHNGTTLLRVTSSPVLKVLLLEPGFPGSGLENVLLSQPISSFRPARGEICSPLVEISRGPWPPCEWDAQTQGLRQMLTQAELGYECQTSGARPGAWFLPDQ